MKSEYRELVARLRAQEGTPASLKMARAADVIEALEARVRKLNGLLWYGWNEMNAIRARSGVPLDEYGHKQGIQEQYWSDVVDAMCEALGDDAKPWASDDARAALATATSPAPAPDAEQNQP